MPKKSCLITSGRPENSFKIEIAGALTALKIWAKMLSFTGRISCHEPTKIMHKQKRAHNRKKQETRYWECREVKTREHTKVFMSRVSETSRSRIGVSRRCSSAASLARRSLCSCCSSSFLATSDGSCTRWTNRSRKLHSN